MHPSVYISIVIMFIIIFTSQRKQKDVIARKLIKNRNMEAKTKMIELAKRFVEKECLIYAFDGKQYVGVVKEVSNNAILIEKDESVEAINLDFIIRIREYPRNKKGKKKSIVLD